jgi:hypothetical protein
MPLKWRRRFRHFWRKRINWRKLLWWVGMAGGALGAAKSFGNIVRRKLAILRARLIGGAQRNPMGILFANKNGKPRNLSTCGAISPPRCNLRRSRKRSSDRNLSCRKNLPVPPC